MSESFRHWQSKFNEQSQAASTAMIGLSSGALAYAASLLDGQDKYAGYNFSMLFYLHGVLQLITIRLGIWLAVNRSRDYSMTAKIARIRSKSSKDQRLPGLRETVRGLGLVSRRLLFWQGILFLVAAAFFVSLVINKYHSLLYPWGGS